MESQQPSPGADSKSSFFLRFQKKISLRFFLECFVCSEGSSELMKTKSLNPVVNNDGDGSINLANDKNIQDRKKKQPMSYVDNALQQQETSSKREQEIISGDDIDMKHKPFKQFDIVEDYSDHHYRKSNFHKTTQKWVKSIEKEWRALENDLPETIYVRIYEERMDILRVAIVGPAGTPYHDGLFFFDIHFPSNYPDQPPEVYYWSHGLRLNPNLYNCGRVCLSLLHTWMGSGCENWNSSKSSLLQVVVSIQALVLNEKPYFNEPDYRSLANTPFGEQRSLKYNERAFILSCKTMLFSLRKPPKHFEELVVGHFLKHGQSILIACRAYMNGARVGSTIAEGAENVVQGGESSHSELQTHLRPLLKDLAKEFAAIGVDCAGFQEYRSQVIGHCASSGAATSNDAGEVGAASNDAGEVGAAPAQLSP
ncbi:ubiquitin-conjugating enzyme E2 38 [Canna indica]|uniref:E2 ubiquitin-conjugating enzyme n=1 Tax=Canna indica TaxID=4628 RepID=A0AAQ3JM66_9LILI|nr:ubiquitin-conjugating enzyme E2 38 [Canna indica]